MNTFYFSYSWNDKRGNTHKAFAYVGVDGGGRVGKNTIEQVIAKIESENDAKPGTAVIDFIYKLAG